MICPQEVHLKCVRLSLLPFTGASKRKLGRFELAHRGRGRHERADQTEGHEEHPAVHRRPNAGVAHLRRATGEHVDLVGLATEQLHQ